MLFIENLSFLDILEPYMTYISFALVFLIMILIFKLFKFKTKTIITLNSHLIGRIILSVCKAQELGNTKN